MLEEIYEICPTYERDFITLKQTSMEDAEELLKCYSDEKSVSFFNSDNCNGDDFYYTSIERMIEAIKFWEFSYKNKYFIRWTIVYKESNEKIGTIEMFHGNGEDEFNNYGVLRIDLQSKYEKYEVINEILQITNEELYRAFEVDIILSKAIPKAEERIRALEDNGYYKLNKNFRQYSDYFIREKENNNSIDMESLKNFCHKYYVDKDIMHDMSHIQRVLKSLEKLIKSGDYSVDMYILTYAAYFHGFIYKDENEICKWLELQGISKENIDKIVTVAWESQKPEVPETLEGKLLHDAHMIEGGKTYLIVKSLITGSVRGQSLEQTIQYIDDNVLGKGSCYLRESQNVYHTQQEFARTFIADLKEGLE